MSRVLPWYGHADMREVCAPVATVWTSPEAPREVDAAAVADVPDMVAWTRALDAESRLGLHGRTLTQLLVGEPVRVLEQHGPWARVAALLQKSSADEDGYPGWVRTAHLADPVARYESPTACVVARSARCRPEDGPPLDLSFGTLLRVDGVTDHAVTVLLPGDRRGRLAPGDVRLPDQAGHSAPEAADLLDLARMFLGVRYLWGGTSSWGLDCSGLVHLVLRSRGVLLPRDAADQARSGRLEQVDPDAVRPGDLYFFARPGERIYHVGFASRPVTPDGTRWMLHAPEGGGLVEDAPLAPHRAETLVSAARLLVGG